MAHEQAITFATGTAARPPARTSAMRARSDPRCDHGRRTPVTVLRLHTSIPPIIEHMTSQLTPPRMTDAAIAYLREHDAEHL